MFVRKRDPRFISNTQTEAQRQAALKAASKEQAARQRAENAAKLKNYKAADWTQVSEEIIEELYDSEETEDENGNDAADEEVEEVEEEEEEKEEEEVIIERYECIVCRKTFGSEGQMAAHERSKKHTKAVHVLKRQMQKENKEFDLDRDVRGWAKSKDEFTPIDDEEEMKNENKENDNDDDEEVEELEAEKKPLPKASSPSPTPSDNEEDEDEYVTEQQFEARVLGNTEDLTESFSNTLNLTSDNEAPKSQPSKIGKAKAKRAKKAAAETETETSTTTCVTCKQSFPSGTKMFNHLRDNPSHAKPVTTTGSGKKGKGKSKRK